MKYIIKAVCIVSTLTILAGCSDGGLEAFKAQPCGNQALGIFIEGSSTKFTWLDEKTKVDDKNKIPAQHILGFNADLKLQDGTVEHVEYKVRGQKSDSDKKWSFYPLTMEVTAPPNSTPETIAYKQFQYFENMYCKALVQPQAKQ